MVPSNLMPSRGRCAHVALLAAASVAGGRTACGSADRLHPRGVDVSAVCAELRPVPRRQTGVYSIWVQRVGRRSGGLVVAPAIQRLHAGARLGTRTQRMTTTPVLSPFANQSERAWSPRKNAFRGLSCVMA